MKKILIGLLAVVLVVVIAVVVLVVVGMSQIDNLLKAGIERGGTYATGVSTTVDDVDVQLRKGTLDLSGLVLANPPGFDTPHFLALAETGMALNSGATDTKNLALASVTLSGIDVYLDKGQNPSNYNAILENLRRFESGDTPPPPEDDRFRVTIDSLVIEDVSVHLANMPGVSIVSRDVAVRVPRIELRDVGKDDPMSMGEVIGLVVKTVLAASVEAGGNIIPGDVLGELQGGLGSLRSLSEMGITGVGEFGKAIEGRLGEAGERAREALDEAKRAGENVRDSVQDSADRLKGIFGGKKDDKDNNTDEP